jgi:lipid II:glycine glycyltransferase (peptidoglycan interpeptide bridge formation enzyme)
MERLISEIATDRASSSGARNGWKRSNSHDANAGSDYRVQISAAVHHPEWDAFVAGVPNGHHVQTSLWGQVKAALGWRAERIIVTRNNEIVAGCQMLIRPVGGFGTLGYVTKGPLCASEDLALTKLIFQAVHRVSAAHQVRYLALQPPNNGQALANRLPDWGFERSWIELAPTASIVIDLTLADSVLLALMKRQTRQNIRRSERAGIKVREGCEADLRSFYDLHLATSRRQQFHPYAEHYLAEMWRVLYPHGYLKLLLAELQGEAVSALLIVPFGEMVIAKLLGWSGLHADCRPNDAVFWGAIKWAKASGYRRFDFEGLDLSTARAVLKNGSLPESRRSSPDFFKLGFGGQVTLYPEAYDHVYVPVVSWLYRCVAPKTGGGARLYRMLDRYRRRFG